nr:MAG TPA: hypothetical protein [Caudoviricetes sp.]
MDKILFPCLRKIRVRTVPYSGHTARYCQRRVVRGALMVARAGKVHRRHVHYHVPYAHTAQALCRSGIGHHRLG